MGRTRLSAEEKEMSEKRRRDKDKLRYATKSYKKANRERMAQHRCQNASLKRSSEIDASQQHKRLKTGWDELLDSFQKKITDGMTHRCYVCDRLWFKDQVRQVKKVDDRLQKLLTDPRKPQLCKTCYSSLYYKNTIPEMAAANGFRYVPKPNLPELNLISQRLIAPRVPFQNIRTLGPCRQYGFQGSVINIPVDVEEMLTSLPRNLENDQCVNVHIHKRKIFKSSAYEGLVNIDHINQWMNYLKDTPLYLEYDITFNSNWSINGNDKSHALMEDMDDLAEDTEGLTEEFDDLVEEHTLFYHPENIHIAPGENQTPISLLFDSDAEELSFPTIYYGHKRQFREGIKPSAHTIAKSEIMRYDRRGASPEHILYIAARYLRMKMTSNFNIAFRNIITTTSPTLTKQTITNNTSTENFMGFMKTIPTTPQYWSEKGKDLRAMIRQHGKPTLFLTMSAAEYHWPELLQQLATIQYQRPVHLEEVYNFDSNTKITLIQRDPVICAAYFHYKTNEILKLLRNINGPFGQHIVEHYFVRVEFQQRGSPHLHCMFWLKDAPGDNDSIVEFVDKIMRCSDDHKNIAKQYHKHTFTCYKKNSHQCRFNIPFYPMDKTRILTPLTKNENIPCENNVLYDKIQRTLLSNDMYHIHSFQDFLKYLDMDLDTYLYAIRSHLDKKTVMLKRNPSEICINNYNPKILTMLNANMDIQFIVDEYGCATYIVDYLNKAQKGMSQLHREILQHKDKMDTRELAQLVGAKTLGAVEMSAQEAAWILLRYPMSKMSEASIFIPTFPPNERFRILKQQSEIEKLPDDSTDIFQKNIIEKYADRSEEDESLCLAEYAAYTNTNGTRRKKSTRIIRFRKYAPEEKDEFFREQILLYLPWRNEKVEIVDVDWFSVYNVNKQLINENASKFTKNFNLEETMERCEEFYRQKLAEEEMDGDDDGKDDVNNELLEDLKRDMNEIPQMMMKYRPFTLLKSEDYLRMMSQANDEQRNFVLNIMDHVKLKLAPIHVFVNGPAGTGKSFLIKLLLDTITRFSNSQSIPVVSTAPTGKAAFSICGTTLHSLFHLPLTQRKCNIMKPLSNTLLKKYREVFSNLSYLIIDEISMVSHKTLSFVHQRLQQIKQSTDLFGGVSVLVFGDLRQLPPVGDQPIYKDKNNLSGPYLWQQMKYYELCQIVRQHNKFFSETLTAIGNGDVLSEDQLELIRSRVVRDVPEYITHIFSDNASVDAFNEKRLEKMEFEVCEATDRVVGHVSDARKKHMLENVKTKPKTKCKGVLFSVKIAIGMQYMIVINGKDGLVNGAIGTLKYIEHKRDKIVKRIWLEFEDKSIGVNARSLLRKYMLKRGISENLVPVERVTIEIDKSKDESAKVHRTQFPITPAAAITIHKAQGTTFEQVAIKYPRQKQRSLIYVALSRCKSTEGLYIYGIDKNELSFPYIKKNELEREMKRLRSSPYTT